MCDTSADESEINQLNEHYQSLNSLSIQLSFRDMLSDWKNVGNLKSLEKQWLHFGSRLDALAERDLSLCESILTHAMQTTSDSQLLAIELLGQPVTYRGNISELPRAKDWYRLLTLFWLGEAVSPDELFEIGETSFNKAIARLRTIKQDSNGASNSSFSNKDTAAIQKAYLDRHHRVIQNLNKLFIDSENIPPLTIARSPLGPEFLAPGYYNPDQKQFYFHVSNDDYIKAQMDFLYLHEGLPGHHMQSHWPDEKLKCNRLSMPPSAMAFVEGWAAYIERYGRDLGLYQEPESEYYAYKWQALRAMRVMVDVGKHAYGWSDNKLKQHWKQLFPEGIDMLERELARIKRWPMQVNTYVYGRHKIERLLAEQQRKADFNLVEFHQQLLSMTHLPLSSIERYNDFNNIK